MVQLMPKYLGGSDNLSEDSRLALEGLLETVEVEWQQFDATQAAGGASSSAFLPREDRGHSPTQQVAQQQVALLQVAIFYQPSLLLVSASRGHSPTQQLVAPRSQSAEQ